LGELARIAGLCLLGLAFGAGASSAATLTGMTVSSEGDVTRIHVMLDQSVEWSQFALSDPARLFVDCRGVDTVLPKSLPGSDGRAGRIEASVWKGEGYHALTRITIDLNQASQAEVTSVEDGILITLGPVPSNGWTMGQSTAETGTASETAALAAPNAAAEPTAEPTAAETVPQTAAETVPPATSIEATPRSSTEGTTPAMEATAPVPDAAATPSIEAPAPTGTPISAPDFETEITAAETMAQNEETLTPAEEETPDPAASTPADGTYSLPPSYGDASSRKASAVKSIPMSDEKGLAARGGARVSLDIQGADIYTVLRSISEYSGVNIVMGYDVTKKVTDPVSFHLESVPWGEALEMVLRSSHLWYREEGNVIRVDTEENLRNEDLSRSNAARQLEDVMPLTTRIIEVIYANARELKPTVEKSLSRRGVAEVDERSNSLVITDIRSRVDGAVEMVQHLDSQTPQVEIVAKLVDVDAQYSRELGVLWSGNQEGPLQGALAPGTFFTKGPNGPNAVLGFNEVADPALGVRFGLVKGWGEVNARISALEKENKVNIISNPRITTVNNREARILVGQKIPLIVLDEAGNPVTELTIIGITLRVIPHINDQNRITLDLHPEVSDLASGATVQGGVIINTSEADTRVMVGNGETAVIGGLIRTNEVQTKTGVPILMDIPILGSFFSQTGTTKNKRELLIFVTPRIINSFSAEGEGH
jgi:type IV pilus assembly protein PilQ